MRILFSFCIILVLIAGAAHAQSSTRTRHFNLEKGIALQGYDPVAYIDQHQAVKGRNEFSHAVEGVTYHFSSAANLEAFRKNYKDYEPQYGGWCAYAMGKSGEKVEVDPETFKVENGKLYLFYNSTFNNTLPKWNKDESVLKPNADKNWMSVYK